MNRKTKSFRGVLKDYRNHWFNEDYLELLAGRLQLGQARDVLDVGCGHFHWTALIAPHFADGASIAGLDLEPVEESELREIRASEAFHRRDLAFTEGDAYSLPYSENTFDLVTCQTLLIHLGKPTAALKEMQRVLRPGGTILVVEPNNLAQTAFTDSLDSLSSEQQRVEHFADKLGSERRRLAAGAGNNSIGETVPILMREIGFEEIRCYLNDRVPELVPPYDEPAQRAKVEMLRSIADHCPVKLSNSDRRALELVNQSIEKREYVSYTPTMLFISVARKMQHQG